MLEQLRQEKQKANNSDRVSRDIGKLLCTSGILLISAGVDTSYVILFALLMHNVGALRIARVSFLCSLMAGTTPDPLLLSSSILSSQSRYPSSHVRTRNHPDRFITFLTGQRPARKLISRHGALEETATELD